MAESPLAVLLRDGTHAGATTRFALKCDQFSIAVSKTPIQVPVPRSAPILLDMGSNRPSITISGIVDNVGGDTSNTTSGFEHMESMQINGQTYYVPYKNSLENKLITWVTGDQDVQIEIGDASVSLIHANFLINKGRATATDIEQLGKKIIDRVFDKFNILLDWEIKVVGD